LGWTGWTKASLATLVTVGALVGVPAGYLALQDDETPAKGASVSPPAKRPGKAPESSAPAPAAQPNETRPEVAPTEPEPAPGRTPQAKVESKADASSAALRAELKALDGARTTLASGNAQGALTLLDAYDRGYPRGLLRLEAEVLRIDALARSGQTEAARRRADAFLRQHPKSVLASRVRRYSAP
jgi:hypothetical protein